MTEYETIASIQGLDGDSFNPHQDAALDLSILAERDIIGIDSEVSTNHFCASIHARTMPKEDEDCRTPIDLIVVLDVSGSMAGNKLKLCKKTLTMLLRVLQTQDRFGLISFGSDARVEFPAQAMSKQNKASALQKIQSLTTRGCTNMSAALGLAVQELKIIEKSNPVRSLFFLTDGLANEGISDLDGLVSLTRNCLLPSDNPSNVLNSEVMIAECLDDLATSQHQITRLPVAEIESVCRAPITLHTFGYGRDHNAALLESLADTTQGGAYYFIEDDSNVGSAFGNALGGIMSIVAQNAVLTIRLPSEAEARGARIVEVYHDQAIKRENDIYTVSLGDFYAEESRDVIFKMELTKPAFTSTLPVAHVEVTLAYTDTLKKMPANTDAFIGYVRRPVGAEYSAQNHYIEGQLLRVLAIREMKSAEDLANQGNFQEAQNRIENIIAKCRQASPTVRDMQSISLLVDDLFDAKASVHSSSTFRQSGMHRMAHRRLEHVNQRSNMVNATGGAYATTTRVAYAKKFQSKDG